MHDDPMHAEARYDGDNLDLLLDDALASYVDPAPSPGLTNHILASTTLLDSRGNLFRWLPWAIPALAALLLLVIFLTHRSTVHHEKSPIAAGLPNPRPSTSRAAPAVASVKTPPRRLALPHVARLACHSACAVAPAPAGSLPHAHASKPTGAGPAKPHPERPRTTDHAARSPAAACRAPSHRRHRHPTS